MNGTIGMDTLGAIMIKIAVIMPILTQHKMALEAVSTVKTRYHWEFIPICNWLNGFTVAESWNHGMGLAKERGCTHALILNDDVLLSSVSVDRLMAAMASDPEIAIVTCRDYRDYWELKQNPYATITFVPEETYISDGPDFAAFMIDMNAYEDIGPFDENFRPAYFEDNDYCYRTILKKYKCVSHMGAPFYHYGSQTQNGGGQPVVPGLQFELNRDYYMSKWGGPPGQERWTVPFNGLR